MADALGCELASDPADIIQGRFPEYVEFISQLLQHVLILPRHLDTAGGGAHTAGDHFRKGYQVLIRPAARQPEGFLAVGQLFDPVKHTCGQLSAAHRAYTVILPGLGRTQAQVAFAVAVKMVFTLLREKLDGSGQPLASLDRAVKPFIGHGDIKQIGLPPQFGWGMGI